MARVMIKCFIKKVLGVNLKLDLIRYIDNETDEK